MKYLFNFRENKFTKYFKEYYFFLYKLKLIFNIELPILNAWPGCKLKNI